MGYYEDQYAILQALRNRIVLNVSDLADITMDWNSPFGLAENDPTQVDARRVIIGKRSSTQSQQWPQAWLTPAIDNMDNMTFHEVLHKLRIDIYISDKGADLESLYLKVLALAGAIYDVIMADRTITGTVDTIDITSVEADYETDRQLQDFYQVARLELICEYHARPECE